MVSQKNYIFNGIKVIVVGLPRSGTSFLTGLISIMGFNLGPHEWLKPSDKHNLDGYFECLPLNSVTQNIMELTGGDFHYNLNKLHNINKIDLTEYKRKILDLVNKGNIEVYKDNKLTVMSKLYDELYPEAKWIYIERSVEDTYRSRFGEYISFEDWIQITNSRKELWSASSASKKSLNLNYNDFYLMPEKCLNNISKHLEIELDDIVIRKCLDFIRPKLPS